MRAKDHPPPSAPRIDMEASLGFAAWLSDISASLVFTSHRSGELIGPNVDEIYDVAFLPRVRNPFFVQQNSEEIRYFIKPYEQM